MNYTKLKYMAVSAGFYIDPVTKLQIYSGQHDVTNFLVKLEEMIRADERKTIATTTTNHKQHGGQSIFLAPISDLRAG